MKLNKMLIALGAVSILSLTACNSTPSSSASSSSATPSSSGSTSSVSSSTSSSSTYTPDLSKNVTLSMSVMYQKAETRMSFGGDKVTFPYKAANGKEYNSGDLKPVWEQVEKDMNITIDDKTDVSSTKIADAFTKYQQDGFKGLNIAQGSASDIISEGTTNGTILKLNEYMDKLPNFKAFLDENPIVRTNIKDAEGDIYYAPYFDGNDDIERMTMVRQDWVEKLLDAENPSLDTATVIDSKYEAYMPSSLDVKVDVVTEDGKGVTQVSKKYSEGKGIIARQNSLTTKNGAALVQALRDYIDETYGNTFTKRSDLFCGQNAAYDADELVALFRCVKANPTYLTGKADATVTPFFTRTNTNDRTADLWRFAGQIFGVRGLESRSGYLYVDKDGKINDARDDQEVVDALARLREMYEEGLIFQDFTSSEVVDKGDYRAYLLKNNLGFATYDYNQTTTIFNNTVDKSLVGDDFLFTSIMPAVANLDGEWLHYTESWRSVKTEGWFITADTAKDADKLNRALALFDYFYSPEGNRLMSYGPDAWIEHDADGNIVTFNYQGREVPKLSEACLTELATLASGNYTNYYRYYLGGTYPIGYVKEQGMEYQTVADAAKPGLERINNAIGLGVIKHVSSQVVTNENHIYDMVPTTFSLGENEQNALKNNYKDLNEAINNTKGQVNMWSNIVMKGFGATVDNVTLPTKESYIEYVKGLNIDSYVAIYNLAYSRMIK